MLEEISWRPKSREMWLNERDRITNFFHKMANAYRRKIFQAKIKINGAWLSQENDIKEGIVRAFQILLIEPVEWRPNLNALLFEGLEAQEATRLENPFSEKEVFNTLSGFNGDKVSGLNGVSMAFQQFSWDFVKDEVMGVFKEFMSIAILSKKNPFLLQKYVVESGGIQKLGQELVNQL